MEHFKYLLLIFTVSLAFPMYSQTNLNQRGEIETPSADAWNMVHYGEGINPDLHTGTVGVSIPFYSYQDSDFTLPISFNYSSNGYKPNEKAGILGPGWSLECGGAITVEVNGIPDFSSYRNQVRGFWTTSGKPEGFFAEPHYWRYVNPYYPAMTSSGTSVPFIAMTPTENPYTPLGTYDAEPDIFHFHFPGCSGTFHFGFAGRIYVYETQGCGKETRIDILDNGNTISIYTGDGYKYTFSGSYDKVMEMFSRGGSELKQKITWWLSSIEAPNGRKIRYFYNDCSTTTCSPASYDLTGTFYNYDFPSSGSGSDVVIDNDSQMETALVANDKLISVPSGISIDNGPLIVFGYDSETELNYDEFSDIAQEQFRHIPLQTACPRISTVDVIYDNDTLKSSRLHYSRSNPGKRINTLSSIEIKGEGNYTFAYHFEQNKPLPGNGTFSIDHWGYYNGKSNNYRSGNFLKIVSTDSNQDETISKTTRESDPSFAILGMLERIDYPSGGYSVFSYEPNDYSKAMARKSPNGFQHTLYEQGGVCGGLRVRSISSFNGSDTPVSFRRFSYESNGTSNGILLNMPRYHIAYTASRPTGGFETASFYSASINHYDGHHIEYSTVNEILADSSRKEYTFTNSTMTKYSDFVAVSYEREHSCAGGDWYLTTNLNANIVAPVSSMKSQRGKLLSLKEYHNKLDVKPFMEQETTYSGYLDYDQIPTYLIRRIGTRNVYINGFKKSRETTYEHVNEDTISSIVDYKYNSLDQISQKTMLTSSGIKELTCYYYTSDSSEVGPVYSALKARNILCRPAKTLHYSVSQYGDTTLVSGRKYHYAMFNGLPEVESEEIYDVTDGSWLTDVIYISYDALGHPTETQDSNGLHTSYVWGYNGAYLVAVISNANISSVSRITGNLPLAGGLSAEQKAAIKNAIPECSFIAVDYLPFVGPNAIIQPDGSTESYGYNRSGKFSFSKDISGSIQKKALYSTDNRANSLQ